MNKNFTTYFTIACVLALTVCTFLFFVACSKMPDNTNQENAPQEFAAIPAATPEPQQTTDFLAPGNPTNAAATDKDNYLLINDAYALSYNNSRGEPNWVAWRVSKDDLGTADRQNDFRPDDRLPNGFTRVTPADYNASGYDRGHLCPSADRSKSVELNSETFLMTNMVPQLPQLNRVVWEHLEAYSRKLVDAGNDLFIVAGAYGEKGKIKGKIIIPTNCWKVIAVVPPGAGTDAISEKTRIIAVDMPNDASIKGKDWHSFQTSVREIERKANVKLFSNLPESVTVALEK